MYYFFFLFFDNNNGLDYIDAGKTTTSDFNKMTVQERFSVNMDFSIQLSPTAWLQ